MKWSNKSVWPAAGAVAALVALAAAQNPPGAAGRQQIKGFRYPIETYPSGKVKMELVAGAMTGVDMKEKIEATDVRVNMFDEQGKLESSLTTDTCVYDAKKGLITSTSRVDVAKGGISLTGQGFEWNVTQQVVRVLSDVKVVLPRPPPAAVKKGATEGGGS